MERRQSDKPWRARLLAQSWGSPGHPSPWPGHKSAPGAHLSLKVSLVITIALGGLACPVSPKNQGVNSQADESQKAQLVPPLCFAVQGLCHSRAAQLGGPSPEQPQAAVRQPHVGFGLPKYRLVPRLTLFPGSAIRAPCDERLSQCSGSNSSSLAAPELSNREAC